MPATVRRRIGDALLFASGVVIVAFVLVAADHRVRERASLLMSGDRPLLGLADVAARAGGLLWIAMHVALRFGVEHSHLTIFAVAAMVLVTLVSWL